MDWSVLAVSQSTSEFIFIISSLSFKFMLNMLLRCFFKWYEDALFCSGDVICLVVYSLSTILVPYWSLFTFRFSSIMLIVFLFFTKLKSSNSTVLYTLSSFVSIWILSLLFGLWLLWFVDGWWSLCCVWE